MQAIVDLLDDRWVGTLRKIVACGTEGDRVDGVNGSHLSRNAHNMFLPMVV